MTLGECYSGLVNIDFSDPDAVQTIVQGCTAALLDPALWAWAVGITLGCGAVGALIGLAKGRWVAGLVWGLVLGPIGWIVIAVAKREPRECPECARKNPPDAKVCHGCGIEFRKYASQTRRSRLKAQDRSRGW